MAYKYLSGKKSFEVLCPLNSQLPVPKIPWNKLKSQTLTLQALYLTRDDANRRAADIRFIKNSIDSN